MRVLIACEESQTVCKAFRKRGFEAYSCDIQEQSGGHPEWHIKGDVLEVINDGWDLIIAHPPCTYLTVTGNKWLKDQPKRKSGALVGVERRDARDNAIKFFMLFANAKSKSIAIENPIGVISTTWRKPDQVIHPWQFGHEASKSTCLWLKNLPLLYPTNIVEKGEFVQYKSGKRCTKWYADAAKHSPEIRAKIRNKTFEGIAEAMAYQWGDFLLNQSK